MGTEPNTENKTLDDVLIDVNRDLWPILVDMIVSSTVLYFAIKPESFIVTAMGIFSLPPQVLMIFYSIAMPLVISAMLSRYILILWEAVLPYPIAFIGAILILPFVLLDKYILKYNLLEKILEYIDGKKEKRRTSQKSRKFLLSNIIIFVSLSSLLFSFYLGDNVLSNHWRPYRNPYTVLISYSHYYCQITGKYNESECKFWKNKLIEYRIKNLLSTPVDYPKEAPKM